MRTRRTPPPRGDPLAPTAEHHRRQLAQLIEQHHPDLARAAHYLVAPEHVDALLTATWLKAWQQHHHYPGPGKSLPWLHQIMIDLAITNPAPGPPGATGTLPPNFTAVDLDRHLIADHIETLLAQLPHHHATLIRRRHLAGQGWHTITKELGYPHIHTGPPPV